MNFFFGNLDIGWRSYEFVFLHGCAYACLQLFFLLFAFFLSYFWKPTLTFLPFIIYYNSWLHNISLFELLFYSLLRVFSYYVSKTSRHRRLRIRICRAYGMPAFCLFIMPVALQALLLSTETDWSSTTHQPRIPSLVLSVGAFSSPSPGSFG